jgi:hypothetical protein
MGHWLQKCDEEHRGRCSKPFGLDLSSFGRLKWLIDVRKKCLTVADESDRYACLSYLWGGVESLKTETNNFIGLMETNSLESHWKGIPRAVRDAIGLVEQLGIPFLWVDALNNIQDDVESKEDDIESMAGIYANAYVTIIAANGWDANHGLREIQGVTDSRNLSSFSKSDFRETLQPFTSIWYTRQE